ncbi:MAG: DNA (cytosine-5-)-methyltransferase [Flavobacteriales bacterium]
MINVAELFAGVGGFRLGLERVSPKGAFKVVFSNQWEPGRRAQPASDVYVARFGAAGHVNADIATVPVQDIPDHDLLVGGFPCQDYSVASTLRNSKGLVGKKGVLWWQIHRILSEKETPPAYLLLENVDRLLGSPVGQRGRDLAVMLRSLDLLGYAVEWRVINAAEYGMPQRRRRVFLVGYHRSSAVHAAQSALRPSDRIADQGILAKAFSCALNTEVQVLDIAKGLDVLSRSFGNAKGTSPFLGAGVMQDGKVYTAKVRAQYSGPHTTLGDVLRPEDEIPKEFYITKKDLKAWKYLKGAKREPRTSSSTGHTYAYSEGGMAFPDPLDKPSRTIITGEGGRSPSRFKHVVCQDGVRFRRLTPVELERLNMFPDDHTAGPSDAWRAFFMGNALVVGVVERIGKVLLEHATK